MRLLNLINKLQSCLLEQSEQDRVTATDTVVFLGDYEAWGTDVVFDDYGSVGTQMLFAFAEESD